MEKHEKFPTHDHPHEPMSFSNVPHFFLIAVVLLSLYGMYRLFEPFWSDLILAAVLATAFYPLYQWVLKKVKGRSSWASFLSCMSIFLLILIPMILFIGLISVEATNAYKVIDQKIQAGVLDPYLKWEKGGTFFDLKEKVVPALHLESVDLKKSITENAQKVSTYLATQIGAIVLNTFSIMVDFILILFALYYFFKDGEHIVKRIADISPLPDKYDAVIGEKLQQMTKATLYGLFFTAIIQGVVGGLGFVLAGISNSVFWGTVMAFASLVPFVGTSIIWLPAVIVLFILGDMPHAIFLLLWGFIVISGIDNVVRPMLIGSKAKSYPLAMFFAVFGGIVLFGLTGIIFGPMILAFAMTLLEIYEMEYKGVLRR